MGAKKGLSNRRPEALTLEFSFLKYGRQNSWVLGVNFTSLKAEIVFRLGGQSLHGW